MQLLDGVSAPKLRILYLSTHADIGGAEVSLLDLFSKLDRETFEPLVVVPAAASLLDRLTELGIQCRVIPMHPLKARNPWPYLRGVWGLMRLLIKEKVDLIHANTDICNQYAILPAKLFRIPILCHIRNIPSRRGFKRMFLSFSDVLVANSKATLKSVSPYGPSTQRRLTVYNYINQARLSAQNMELRKRWGIPENAFVAVQMARISPFKGQHIFLETLFDLMPRYPNLYAVIAGDTKIDNSDDYLAALQATVRRHSLGHRILFPGFVREVGDLLSASDTLILVSEEEGFGRVLVEAMMMKKPVIASRVAGPSEIIQDGETGLLVKPGDSEDLSRALTRLMTDREWARQLAENGQAWARGKFSPSNTYQAMEEVYRETVLRGSSVFLKN